jgi:hypothetical protein
MAHEVALNIMTGNDGSTGAFMVTRSTRFHSGNWFDLEECIRKAILKSHNMGRTGYYEGRPYKTIAGICMLRWSDE